MSDKLDEARLKELREAMKCPYDAFADGFPMDVTDRYAETIIALLNHYEGKVEFPCCSNCKEPMPDCDCDGQGVY